MRQILICFIVASFLALVPTASGQGPGFGGKPEAFEPTLVVDWGVFKSDQPGKSRLEIYYQVYNFGLQFLPDGKEFVASYDVSAEVFDKDNSQVESYERTRQVRVSSQAQTRSRYDYRTSQITLNLEPGKYRVRFVLTDNGSKSDVRRELTVPLPPFRSNSPELSSVEFVQSITKRNDSVSVFDKGSSLVVPSVSRSFGGEDDKRLLLYMEISAGADSSERVVLESIIRHRSRGVVYRDTVHLVMSETVKPHLSEVNVAEFPPGDYELEVILHGRRMKDLDKKNEPFSIMWTQEALIKLDWKMAVAQMSYISTPGEAGKVRKAKSIEERRAAFNEFWSQRDPSIGTPENEKKREFYRRINVANNHFSSMRREGWRTDRGRIYVINGEPDQIDDEPYSPNVVAYQIWHYYREGRYRRFVFLDKDEDGDYRLQYPYDGLNQRPDF